MGNVSRRDFIKGLAAGAVSVGALGLTSTAGVAFAEGSDSKLYIPGTYSSEQATEFAKIKVSCTFSESAITDVSYEVLETSEDDYFVKMELAVNDEF